MGKKTSFKEQFAADPERALDVTREARTCHLGMKEQPRFSTNSELQEFINTGFDPDSVWDYSIHDLGDGEFLYAERKRLPNSSGQPFWDDACMHIPM